MTLLVGSLATGLILSLLAFGILISFRVVKFEDLTVDGAFTLGGAVMATLVFAEFEPLRATLMGALAAGVAGTVTATLHTRFKINRLLSGILVMTALYSVNLRVMGKSTLPLQSKPTLMTYVHRISQGLFGEGDHLKIFHWEVPSRDVTSLLLLFLLTILIGCLLFIFFRTNLGLAMLATGDNSRMTESLGVNINRMTVLSLFLANALIGLSGALLAQYQGYADAQMGVGMLVLGVASVILGESLVGTRKIGYLIVGAFMGSVLFRLMIAIALRWGLNPNDLKLITAVFVFAALVFPKIFSQGASWLRGKIRA